jgi:hypothetical protein
MTEPDKRAMRTGTEARREGLHVKVGPPEGGIMGRILVADGAVILGKIDRELDQV